MHLPLSALVEPPPLSALPLSGLLHSPQISFILFFCSLSPRLLFSSLLFLSFILFCFYLFSFISKQIINCVARLEDSFQTIQHKTQISTTGIQTKQNKTKQYNINK